MPKVIDFGVARGTDSDMAVTTQQTNLGQLVGTLQYMSPEQCDGDPHEIDARSDVYSLGVVLYELLTGAVPYDATKSTIYQATRIVKEAQPPRPSTTTGWHGRPARVLLGDLDTIVLKALEKDREKRYPSAAALADDIRRYRNYEPIAARSPTVWSRSVRWALRHPVWVTAGACALVTACAALATAAGVWLTLKRPFSIVSSREGREVRLLSVAGNVLHRWPVAEDRILYDNWSFAPFAVLRDQPASLGGRRLALIAYMGDRGSPHLRGLSAIDVAGDLDVPVWRGQVGTADIPPKLKLRTDYEFIPEQFGVSAAILADVFPELPGEEVVVAHKHFAATQTAIRVYDLAGATHYQVWVDADINAMYWMSGPHLLVLAGANGEAYWEERGERGWAPHPRVVFALQPECNSRTPEYVAQEPAARNAADPRLRPVWYKCLRPVAFASQEGPLRLQAPDRPWSKTECVLFSMDIETRYPAERAGIWWVLDKDGEMVTGPILDELYRRNQMLPDDDPRKLPAVDWRLGDLPPILNRASATPATRQ